MFFGFKERPCHFLATRYSAWVVTFWHLATLATQLPCQPFKVLQRCFGISEGVAKAFGRSNAPVHPVTQRRTSRFNVEISAVLVQGCCG